MNARGLLDTFLVAGFTVDYLLTLLFIIIIIINHAGLESQESRWSFLVLGQLFEF
jgi:hypothetical protein